MTSPHRIGQVTKAQLLIADALDRWEVADTNDRAAWLIAELIAAGWNPPHDPADIPPLRPANVATPQQRAQHVAQARNAVDASRRAITTVSKETDR